jgi:hypothetical protein
MTMDWLSTKAEDITLTRVICNLAEQVFLAWFGAYTHKSAVGSQKQLARLGPWIGKPFAYTGTNMISPIRVNILRAEGDATCMNPQELNKRTADILREHKKTWTSEELKEVQDKRHSYHRRVANPVRRFKAKAQRRKMPKAAMDEKVRRFQAAERLAIQNGEENTKNAERILTL